MKFIYNDGSETEMKCMRDCVCNPTTGECFTVITFPDNSKFVMEKQRAELFDYVRSIKCSHWKNWRK